MREFTPVVSGKLLSRMFTPAVSGNKPPPMNITAAGRKEFNVDEILKELDFVYRILLEMPVSGNNVKRLAIVETKLEHVYSELAKLNTKEDTGNGGQ